MFEAKEDALLGPGTWRLWRPGPPPLVFMACPKCMLIAMLDHEIAADGTLTPSVQCAKEGCSFHESVRLVGWGKEV